MFKVRGLNVVLVVFSLLVLGTSAYLMSTGALTSFRSGASNVVQSATGKLVKKGNPDFAPCGKNANFTYGLLGAQVLGLNVEAASAPTTTPVSSFKPTPSPFPTPTPVRVTPTPFVTAVPTSQSTPTSHTAACTPLTVNAFAANPLVGKRVLVTGTMQNGMFYATIIKLVNATPTPSPRSSGVPSPTPTPYIHVYSPNGNEVYKRGQSVTISFISGGLSNVLLYVENMNGVGSLINGSSANVNGGVTNYIWTANPPNFINNPNTSSNAYKIKVSGGTYTDSSDNFFTITP